MDAVSFDVISQEDCTTYALLTSNSLRFVKQVGTLESRAINLGQAVRCCASALDYMLLKGFFVGMVIKLEARKVRTAGRGLLHFSIAPRGCLVGLNLGHLKELEEC